MTGGETVRAGWLAVRDRVERACARAGRDPNSVRIVAVSKTVSPERMEEAAAAGARIFGESYIQEALPKIETLRGKPEFKEIEWHFVGALQSNKAVKAVGAFSLIHSLDRWSLAKELEKASQRLGLGVDALMEVNVGGEATKGGLPPGELETFARRISSETNLRVHGLMVFPPPVAEPEDARKYFAEARELAKRLDALGLERVSGRELSMGITDDFETAIEEGSTIVRVGTAVFGARS